ncbi:hypothetical protein JOL62DRAFT_573344 [Phyllosticta paracitricarpa]|uniref:Secreted protein n=1 Tax=Phyllosticta paracitricarpa TaxID=2016321 RepID=A0ABR1N7R8_9PEZI
MRALFHRRLLYIKLCSPLVTASWSFVFFVIKAPQCCVVFRGAKESQGSRLCDSGLSFLGRSRVNRQQDFCAFLEVAELVAHAERLAYDRVLGHFGPGKVGDMIHGSCAGGWRPFRNPVGWRYSRCVPVAMLCLNGKILVNFVEAVEVKREA